MSQLADTPLQPVSEQQKINLIREQQRIEEQMKQQQNANKQNPPVK